MHPALFLATVMIVGLGIDLVASSRMEREPARDEWLQGDGIFTSQEISRCSRNRRPALCYAACFAAKEATLKALALVDTGVGFRQIEVERNSLGACTIKLHGAALAAATEAGVTELALSLSHEGDFAAAIVFSMRDQ